MPGARAREVAGEGWLQLDSLEPAPQPLAGLAGALARLAALAAQGSQVLEIWEGEPPPYLLDGGEEKS